MEQLSYRKKYEVSRRSARNVFRERVHFGNMRSVALSRDNYKCVKCGMSNEEHLEKWKRKLTVDHIDGKGRYSEVKNNDINNLQTLCLSCHGKKDHRKKLKYRFKRKIEIATNEDGDVYGAVYNTAKVRIPLTKIGALRAINKQLDEWGLLEDIKITLNDLERCEFWTTTGGDHDGWMWWREPTRDKYKFDSIEYLGWGWIYKIY